jgi:cytochrome c
MMCGRARLACTTVLGGFMLLGCTPKQTAPIADAADPRQGALALQRFGCGACHRIPGVAGAEGVVGPPLLDLRERVYIGRGLPNTRDNLSRWIRTPQAFAPGSAMPDLQVPAADATAMTNYLYRRGE